MSISILPVCLAFQKKIISGSAEDFQLHSFPLCIKASVVATNKSKLSIEASILLGSYSQTVSHITF